MDAHFAKYHDRDCLIHSDSHVFNILVEAKPSIEELEDFGPDGTVVLCDWEMAMA
jgi:thiamine kinase-like enzyme